MSQRRKGYYGLNGRKPPSGNKAPQSTATTECSPLLATQATKEDQEGQSVGDQETYRRYAVHDYRNLGLKGLMFSTIYRTKYHSVACALSVCRFRRRALYANHLLNSGTHP